MRNKHINTICKQLGISLASIQKYNREHRDDIEHIKDIFTLKGDYREKYLALLYMFSDDDDEDIIKRYREQKGMNNAEYDSAQLLERYKVLLITALVYDKDFYAMVINDIGFASMGINIKGAGRDFLLSVVQPGDQNRQGNIIGFPKPRSGAAEGIAAAPSTGAGNNLPDISFE